MGNKKYAQDNKRRFFLGFLLIIMLFLSLLIIATAVYLLYLNIPGTPQSSEIYLNEPYENENFPKTSQFYSNMKFNHNSISYTMDSSCEQEKQERMISAFNMLSDEIKNTSFYEVPENPDIEVSCSEKNKKTLVNEDYFIAGEGGAKEIIQTGKYNVIMGGIILLYENSKNSLKCDSPNTELHELIHVFGFTHSADENSLMYPLLESCSQKLDNSIIEELKRLYSEENLPDLYFEDIKAIKKGRYLDFNATIKNSGTINANNIELTIFDDEEPIETRKIEEIKYGAGIILEIQNLKLSDRNSKEIEFIIDYKNQIKEFDKKNNRVRIKFNEN
jgi:hypothetical protein